MLREDHEMGSRLREKRSNDKSQNRKNVAFHGLPLLVVVRRFAGCRCFGALPRSVFSLGGSVSTYVRAMESQRLSSASLVKPSGSIMMKPAIRRPAPRQGAACGDSNALASASAPTRTIRPFLEAQHSMLPFTRKVMPPNIRFWLARPAGSASSTRAARMRGSVETSSGWETCLTMGPPVWSENSNDLRALRRLDFANSLVEPSLISEGSMILKVRSPHH